MSVTTVVVVVVVALEGIFVIFVVVRGFEESVRDEEANGVRFNGGRVEEGDDREALVAAGEGIGGVDVGVARHAEGGGVGSARDTSRSLLADLAHPDALVARSQLVGAVDLGVATHAEEGRVGSAEELSRGSLARVTGSSRYGPAARERAASLFLLARSHHL